MTEFINVTRRGQTTGAEWAAIYKGRAGAMYCTIVYLCHMGVAHSI